MVKKIEIESNQVEFMHPYLAVSIAWHLDKFTS